MSDAPFLSLSDRAFAMLAYLELGSVALRQALLGKSALSDTNLRRIVDQGIRATKLADGMFAQLECVHFHPEFQRMRDEDCLGFLLSDGMLELRAEIRRDRERVILEGFEFDRSPAAPTDFKIYRVLRNPKLIKDCKYSRPTLN